MRQGVDALGAYPSKIHSLWQTVFEGKARDPNGAIGVVGLGEIGGQVASDHSIDVRDKIAFLIGLLASVNLLLFFFNLLPLLPLDGGHVAGALVEAAKRGRARLRVRNTVAADGTVRTREPIYVDTAQMLPVVYTIASRAGADDPSGGVRRHFQTNSHDRLRQLRIRKRILDT